MKLIELCRAAGIDCPNASGNTEITSVASDSRAAGAGCLFVCIRGLHTDGHAYLADAVSAGAVCVLTEEGAEYEILPGVVYLTTGNTRSALSKLCNAIYGYPTEKLRIIGVTGTNGKTSVTNMLRAILEASLFRCGLIGTVGCESAGRYLEAHSRDPLANMTTPDPEDLYRILAEMVADGVEYVLMEVTSHALALGKLSPIRFEASIFTNLTPEHLDFHGTMDAYADAKAILFSQSKLSVINIDSPYACRMTADAQGRTVTTGTHGKSADYCADDIHFKGRHGVEYTMRSTRTSLSIKCPVPGSFSVANSLQAAVCAMELGIGPAPIQDALSTMSGVRGRMERVRLGLGADFSVFIDYAHTPDALENLLRTAADMRAQGERIVLLFGCGGDRDRSKRRLMGSLASSLADFVIVTADNSRSENPNDIIKEILSGMNPEKPYTVIPDRAEAIRYAVRTARAGDWILLAGKGHEEYEIIGNKRIPFIEKAIVAEAFASRSDREINDSTENGS